jgi:ribosomal protein L12E/L44/L45/RPP1/RPP2
MRKAHIFPVLALFAVAITGCPEAKEAKEVDAKADEKSDDKKADDKAEEKKEEKAEEKK